MSEKERGAAKLRRLQEKLLRSAAKRAAEREEDSDDDSPLHTLLDLELLKATRATSTAATAAARGLDDQHGRPPNVSDLLARLANSFDYTKGGDTTTFFEVLEDHFDVLDVKEKFKGACLLLCTTGTIHKQLQAQR